jgi:hypothetical protein
MRTNARAGRGKREGRGRKERKSFTLSPESVAVLDQLRHSRAGARRRSTSAVLDELLRSVGAERRRRAVERDIAAYYDGLSEEAREEENRWGEFALAQFIGAEP